MTSSFYCDHLFTGSQWLAGVRLEVDTAGFIADLEVAPPRPADRPVAGCVVPGVPNAHSHAHQRAMAGFAERSGPGDDSFWTWREVMYRHASRMGPEELEAVAAMLYVEMLEAGYTAVGEFQYLHHDPAGRPYADLAELSRRCLAAAEQTGIGLTSLPVLYCSGGFGGQPPQPGQRRFVNDVETFLRLVEGLEGEASPQHAVGVAPHSLRAVDAESLASLVSAFAGRGPIHLHVAEQQREVADCLAWSGARPVAWLLDAAPVDERWCLIHSTHLDDDEVQRLAASGAVAGLCPTTEANLGDGFFRAVPYLAAGGAIAIGSDSHSSISPVEELRWLEYGQRLRREQRNCLAGGPRTSTGRRLLTAVLDGGAQALGRPIGALEPGRRADFVALDTDHPLLYGRTDDDWLDAWTFSGNAPLVREVIVGGLPLVTAGRHVSRSAVAARYRSALDRLRKESP
ncbi:MAG: formimidoylglutamate deiminase [Acidobacteriota bacterium]